MNTFKLQCGQSDKKMLIFGHTGITLATAVVLNGALDKSHRLTTRGKSIGQPQASTGKSVADDGSSDPDRSWLDLLAGRIDIRLLLIGSLLPDIIDKPVGLYFFRDTINNGRIYCHTLLFLIVITLIGLGIYRGLKQSWVLALSFGTFMHLILDSMWWTPRTLFWPLYGFSFEKAGLPLWIEDIIYALLNDPMLFMSKAVELGRDIIYTLLTNPTVYLAILLQEVVGAAILLWLVSVLVSRGKFGTFIINGRV